MTEEHIKIYHHPNPEIKSFLTSGGLFPPRVEFYINPLNENENERLSQLGAIASQIIKDIMALPGVMEIRVKPKEIRMKKEENASWSDIEPLLAFQLEFQPDLGSMNLTPGARALEHLDYRMYKWPGHGLPDTQGYQAVEAFTNLEKVSNVNEAMEHISIL